MRDGWVETTLDQAAVVVMGQSPPGASYNESGDGLPFIQGSAEFQDHHPRPVKWCTDPRKIAQPGDVLLSVRAPVGDTNVADQVIAVGRGLAILRQRDDAAITPFLRLLLGHSTKALLSRSGSGMFTSITGSALKSLPVALPPLAEQRRIVDLVGALDEAIQAADRARSWTRSTLLARADEIHTRRASNRESLGSIAPHRGLIGGPFGSSLTSKDYVDDGVPVIRGGNMNADGRYVGGNFAFVSEEKAETLARNQAAPGDLIFTQRGTLGQVSMVPSGGYPAYVVSQSQMRLRVDPERDSAEFLYYVFSAPRMVREILARNTATANPHINLGILSSLEVPRPSLAEQRAEVEFLDAFSAVDSEQQRAADVLRDLRSNLLTVLLSGEHDIPESYDELLSEVP